VCDLEVMGALSRTRKAAGKKKSVVPAGKTNSACSYFAPSNLLKAGGSMGNTQGTQLCEEKVFGVCNDERECPGIMPWNCGSEHPQGTVCMSCSHPL
jgi:hypothetical protein